MNASVSRSDAPLPEEACERISAYLDGELSPDEQAEIERLLGTNAAARRLADDLLALRNLCQEQAAPTFDRDLSQGVLAEALRRQAAGSLESPADNGPHEPKDLRGLEPDGEFGLPFGRSARGWVWAGVAAAAALMIGFYGRPEPRGGSGSFDQNIAAMQRAVPGLQVVDVETTPERWQRVLGERLAPSAAPELPVTLAAAKRSGLQVEPAAPMRDAKEQLLYLDGGREQVEGLLAELRGGQGSLHQVGPDHSAASPGPPASNPALPNLAPQAPVRAIGTQAATPLRVVRLKIQLRRIDPSQVAPPTQPATSDASVHVAPTPTAPVSAAPGTSPQPIVLRIRFRETP
ncbi:hypothetical protein Pla111_18060 [Botrimarina hoheduenensis]|uniref:Putative zinc-finger domain-containing protein n=2 Tax=Botrimarina hoheduenensis TaxID=2528000 RepID=A0A5C5W932_9BACT|nr:hypothetical protein Pla111_18060 [Botrimarina hoheduenensis]